MMSFPSALATVKGIPLPNLDASSGPAIAANRPVYVHDDGSDGMSVLYCPSRHGEGASQIGPDSIIIGSADGALTVLPRDGQTEVFARAIAGGTAAVVPAIYRAQNAVASVVAVTIAPIQDKGDVWKVSFVQGGGVLASADFIPRPASSTLNPGKILADAITKGNLKAADYTVLAPGQSVVDLFGTLLTKSYITQEDLDFIRGLTANHPERVMILTWLKENYPDLVPLVQTNYSIEKWTFKEGERTVDGVKILPKGRIVREILADVKTTTGFTEERFTGSQSWQFNHRFETAGYVRDKLERLAAETGTTVRFTDSYKPAFSNTWHLSFHYEGASETFLKAIAAMWDILRHT